MEERFEFGARVNEVAADEFAAGEVFDLGFIPADEEVDAAWCLRCGICHEQCPVQAIAKR